MKLTKIYVEATEEIIELILTLVRPHIGEEVRVVDLNPELKESDA